MLCTALSRGPEQAVPSAMPAGAPFPAATSRRLNEENEELRWDLDELWGAGASPDSHPVAGLPPPSTLAPQHPGLLFILKTGIYYHIAPSPVHIVHAGQLSLPVDTLRTAHPCVCMQCAYVNESSVSICRGQEACPMPVNLVGPCP